MDANKKNERASKERKKKKRFKDLQRAHASFVNAKIVSCILVCVRQFYLFLSFILSAFAFRSFFVYCVDHRGVVYFLFLRITEQSRMELRREEKTKQASHSLYSYMIHHDRKIFTRIAYSMQAINKTTAATAAAAVAANTKWDRGRTADYWL